MIKEHELDPYDYYNEFTGKTKIKYINKRLKKDRRLLIEKLWNCPLLFDLNTIIVNMCYYIP